MGQKPCLPLLCCLLIISKTNSLNLDTKFPVKLVQPLRSEGSHFGFSVAADVRSANPRFIVSALLFPF